MSMHMKAAAVAGVSDFSKERDETEFELSKEIYFHFPVEISWASHPAYYYTRMSWTLPDTVVRVKHQYSRQYRPLIVH